MQDDTFTRRDMLRWGGAAAGAGVLGGLAGCTAPGNDDNGTDTGTPTDTPDGPAVVEGAPYADWMPEPGTLGGSDHYQFSAVDLTEVAQYNDSLPKSLEKSHVSVWDPIDIDWQDVSLSLRFEKAIVLQGAYDPETVRDDITSGDDWSVETSYDDYDILRKEDGQRAIGVSDEAIVSSQAFGSDDDVVKNVETVIDTSDGDKTRYIGSSDDMYALVEGIGEGTIVAGRSMEEPENPDPGHGRFAGQVGAGRWATMQEGRTDVRMLFAYRNEDAVDTEDLQTYVDQNSDDGETFGNWNDISIRKDGRLGIIEGYMGGG